MQKFIYLTLIFLLSNIQALAVEIRGKVLNLGGSPVIKAEVLHRSSGVKSITDAEGLFTLSVPDDTRIRLEINHPDYVEQEVIITEKNLQRQIVITLVPYIIQREEVVVTAMRHPESSASVPAAETVVLHENLEEEMVPNITEGISSMPGVSSMGAGGFSLVPNIRGLARRRVLILIDHARVTSDRRTGPNASFIDPKDIERIEVLRSPSSVLYGSDAIGGVIHILTKKPSLQDGFSGIINGKSGTINQGKGGGATLEGSRKNTGFYLSFQANDAENYSSPSGEILQSQFTQGTLIGKISHVTDKREVFFSFFGSRGSDLGKANQLSLTQPTWYPKENQNYFQIHWNEKGLGKEGELAFQAYLNPNFLETIKVTLDEATRVKTEESYSKIQSLNFGAHLSYRKKIGEHFRLSGGLDLYGRSTVESTTRDTDFDASGNVTNVLEQKPFSQGERMDMGIFLSADYSGVKNLDLIGGIRWDNIRLKALPGDTPPSADSEYTAWTGFMGGSFKLTEEIVLFANIAKAYRAPSLNELFYTGITGRGMIIAQPDLRPETSFNLDGGVKFIFKRLFTGFYLFYYEIDDLIERYMIDPIARIRTYGNVEEGRLSGWELEVEYYPVPKWKLFGNLYSFKGTSTVTGEPLNDIPPSRLFLGTRVWFGRFTTEMNATIQLKKDDMGPDEMLFGLPGYEVVNLKASYYYNKSFRFYLLLSNLINSAYIARPDPDAVEEPGRNLVLGLSYSF
ncbi:MAG: TonB-dependent receptor [Candidatus Aminicenantes bacterium]|nr:MAG: TonB-dependent receptor [Candidatus Aminicenantes bacterium]